MYVATSGNTSEYYNVPKLSKNFNSRTTIISYNL